MSPTLTTSLDERPITDLTAKTQQRVNVLLCTYTALTTDIDLLTEQREQYKQEIASLLESEGVDKARADDYALAWVRGATTTSLDKQRLLEAGVSTAQIEHATVTKPKKPYFQIRNTKKSTARTTEE